MDYKTALNIQLATILERQAQIVEDYEQAPTHEVVKLRLASNKHWQTAYRNWFSAHPEPMARLESKDLTDESKFLTQHLRVSCQRIIKTGQAWRLVPQLVAVLNGIALIAATQPHMFLDGDLLAGTYGKTIDDLRQHDKRAARTCLNYLDAERMELAPAGKGRRALHKWLSGERAKLAGKRKFCFPGLVAVHEEYLAKEREAGRGGETIYPEYSAYKNRSRRINPSKGLQRYTPL